MKGLPGIGTYAAALVNAAFEGQPFTHVVTTDKAPPGELREVWSAKYPNFLGILGGLWAERWEHYAALLAYFLIPFSYLSAMFFSTETLPPFGSGSLAGYWTLEEVKMKLDDLVASDTHDVVADKIWSVACERLEP